jgi:hypothetical protein
MEEYTLDKIVNIVLAVINSGVTPAIPVDPTLILAGGFLKPGLSARDMAKEVILRQQEAGIPIGNLPSGGENIAEKMERIRMEVIVKHLLENAKFSIVIPPGTPIAATGASPVGPVAVAGSTVGISIGTAIIS